MKPDIKVVCAQPTRGHYIQGLKNMEEAIVPDIYDPSKIDIQEMVESEEAIAMARRIIACEAIFRRHVERRRPCWLPSVRPPASSGATSWWSSPDRAEKYLSTTMFDEFND